MLLRNIDSKCGLMRKQNVMNNAGLPVLEIGEQVIKDKILDNTDDPWCETFVLLVSL